MAVGVGDDEAGGGVPEVEFEYFAVSKDHVVVQS